MSTGFANTAPVGPLSVVVTTLEQAVSDVVSPRPIGGGGLAIHLVNAYTVALADKDQAYRQVIQRGVALPDGRPLEWVSRLRGDSPQIRQVRGPSLFELAFDRGRAHQTRHYLLGSTPEVLEKLVASLESKYPGASIVGAESPPFRSLSTQELSEQDDRIRAARPNVVWVGLGTPKQDIETSRLAEAIDATVIAIGAAFDFSAGSLPIAPRWMLQFGLEWLYRLAREPRRLWRRYVFGNARFIWVALRGRP